MKSHILKILKSSAEYISGEDLSRELNVSRTAVWKNINALKEEGYVISSVRNKGYRLEQCPDILDEEIIKNKLQTKKVKTVGTGLSILKTVDSTNEEVKRRAANGEPEGLVVAAEEQTAGKGRLGRNWQSHADGGVYFTILIRPELPPSDIASITLAAGYAVCLAVRSYTGCDARIKWPNDIIIGTKKVCGILTEMAAQSDRLDYVAIGIGINVNQSKFPDEITDKATSLLLETGNKLDRSDFLAAVIKQLDTVLNSFLVSLSITEFSDFKNLCATIGRTVSVERNGVTLTGTADDITTKGELIINTGSQTISVNSGEVTVQGIY